MLDAVGERLAAPSGDAHVSIATAGADYERDRLLAGLAVAYSAGDGTFDHAASGDSGSLQTVLLGVYPYVRLALHERLAVWASYRVPVGGGVLTPRVAPTAASLWSLPDPSGLAARDNFDPSGPLDAELSYGLDALDGAATVSPYAGLTVAGGGVRTWRVGTRFRHDASLSLSLAGAGRENVGAAEPGHTVELRASLRH